MLKIIAARAIVAFATQTIHAYNVILASFWLMAHAAFQFVQFLNVQCASLSQFIVISVLKAIPGIFGQRNVKDQQ